MKTEKLSQANYCWTGYVPYCSPIIFEFYLIYPNLKLGPCVRGTFEFDMTTDGFSGFYTCQYLEGSRAWDAQRTSIFRPPDSQCALLYKPDTLDLEGEWIDASNSALNIDICFQDPDDDDETVKASLQHRTSAGVIEDWFIAGTWYNDGKILQGTWYTDLNAGAIMLYLRNNGNIDYFWWTGLVFDSGQTYIDYLQLGDITNHGRGTFNGPRSQIVYEDCSKYEVLEKYVKVNLPRDDDDNYYYFIQTYYLDHYLFNYLVPDGATTMTASLIVIIAGLIAVLI